MHGWNWLFTLGQGSWSVMNLLHAYTRPDGVINTSPVTTTLPVIYKTVNVVQVHVVQVRQIHKAEDILQTNICFLIPLTVM